MNSKQNKPQRDPHHDIHINCGKLKTNLKNLKSSKKKSNLS